MCAESFHEISVLQQYHNIILIQPFPTASCLDGLDDTYTVIGAGGCWGADASVVSDVFQTLVTMSGELVGASQCAVDTGGRATDGCLKSRAPIPTHSVKTVPVKHPDNAP